MDIEGKEVPIPDGFRAWEVKSNHHPGAEHQWSIVGVPNLDPTKTILFEHHGTPIPETNLFIDIHHEGAWHSVSLLDVVQQLVDVDYTPGITYNRLRKLNALLD